MLQQYMQKRRPDFSDDATWGRYGSGGYVWEDVEGSLEIFMLQ